VDVNLDSLKHEVSQYLEDTEFAVFRCTPGGPGHPEMVLWDVKTYPDFRMFLEVARKAGARLILFGTDELESSDLDDLKEQLGECELSREERRDYESRLRALAKYDGRTCTLELGFSIDGRMYVYDVQPDWYEEFMELEDEILSRISEDEDLDDDTLGGYYSKN
jgi:hypothetical protein